MNEKVLKTLEYDKIINQLTELASSPLGKEYCSKLKPETKLSSIRKMQTQTSDALSLLLAKGDLSLSGTRDIRPSLARLEIGASLGMEELLSISSLLRVTARAKAYARKENPADTKSSTDNAEDSKNTNKESSLTELFAALEPLTPLAGEIDRCILSPEEMADDASSGLHSVRRAIKNTNDKIHEQLNSLVNGSSRTMLQEAIITTRSGRYCLPVKAEYRNSFPGMVHDQSSTGSTVFIEPQAVVRLNNELKELAAKEQEEIEKILAALSNLAAEESEQLRINFLTLSELDFLFAKGRLSRQLKGSEPEFNDEGYIHIKQGRHPLIDKKKVVSIDIFLGKDFKLLIVTGPNTGGKTVSLKTVGLFTIMGQAGLHIPAFDHSKLAVFDEVYADIGDEQSIEQSLSTFSSHMVNTVSILKQADEHSLVLFDELGAGTDPVEGAALAMSILENLLNRGTTAMATTHYSELKLFALSTPGVSNASCEFDVATLRPTYRLLIGIPGKSNAFAISGKLGLSDAIIEDARHRINSEEQSFEDVITELNETKKRLEAKEAELLAANAEVEKLKTDLTTRYQNLDNSRDRILKKANEEAEQILSDAKAFADETIRKYNKLGKSSDNNKEMEHMRQELRDKISKVQSSSTAKPKKTTAKNYTAADFTAGTTVRVISLNSTGTVCSAPNSKGNVFVQMGVFKSQININDLEIVDDVEISAPNLTKTGSGKIKMNKSANIHSEINLIGKTVDEAIPLLDKYLDDAYLAHLSKVSVIHGRGTGALKNAVHNHLKRTSYVASYRLGEFGEGSFGVTIVEFK